MTSRDLVVQHLTERMHKAFARGNVADAQNLEVFLSTVEGMTNAQFDHLNQPTAESAEAEGSIS